MSLLAHQGGSHHLTQILNPTQLSFPLLLRSPNCVDHKEIVDMKWCQKHYDLWTCHIHTQHQCFDCTTFTLASLEKGYGQRH